jgi:long-chain acyl-CoA synthetase
MTSSSTVAGDDFAAPSAGPAPLTIEDWARRKPDAIAAIEGDHTLTWGQWNDRADRLAAALAKRGVTAGDIVVVRVHNRVEWPVIASALAKLGARLLGMNFRLTAPEVRHVLNDSRSVVVICDDTDPAALLPAFDGRTLKAAVSLDADAVGFERLDALLAEDGETRFFSTADPQLVIYTSGTTGLPKGVVHQRNTTDPMLVEYLADVRDRRGATEQSVLLVTMPMHHGSGPAQVFGALRAGAQVVLLRRFDALAALEAIQRHGVTHWTGVPTMFKRLAALPAATFAAHDVSSLRALTVGAAPVSDELKAWIIAHLGDSLSEGYGSTETGMISSMPPDLQRARPGSSGRPYRHVKIEIRDGDGKVLAVGQTGEIWVWTPTNIRSYLNAAPLGSDTIDARGYFRTGDMGRLDGDGFLYISDRAKDMIIAGGVNIYPAEIEHALITHPAVMDAAVIGIPDDEMGERVLAFVELSPGCSASAGELLEHCAGTLAPYKRPREIRIVDELPRNTVGKLVKRELRAPFWQHKERQV